METLTLTLIRCQEQAHRDHGADFDIILQEDNDSCHGMKSLDNPVWHAKSAAQIHQTEEFPPYSSDLAPSENVWRILKQRIKSMRPTTVLELIEAMHEAWDSITQDEINALYVNKDWGMHARCARVYEDRGDNKNPF